MIQFIKRNWDDPVWSKVFAVGICSIISGLITLIIALFKNIPFASVIKYLQDQTISISYFWLIVGLIFTISIVLPMLAYDVVSVRLKLSKLPLRFRSKELNLESLLNGNWKCSYKNPASGAVGREEPEIKDGNKYHLDGKLYFVLTDVAYDPSIKKISWNKTSYPGGGKHSRETLTIVSNTLMEGEDDTGFNIKYSKNI